MSKAKAKSGACTICTQHFQLLHWHHTIPQALGGKNSLQIPLCAQCHNQLHAYAEAIVAQRRTGRKIRTSYWANETEELNAQPFVKLLVDSISAAVENSVEGKLWMLSSRIPDNVHKALHLFKIDSGLRNLDQALLLCLAETLKKKGYLNGNDNSDTQKNQSGAKEPPTPLW
jgi:hypothetical protein